MVAGGLGAPGLSFLCAWANASAADGQGPPVTGGTKDNVDRGAKEGVGEGAWGPRLPLPAEGELGLDGTGVKELDAGVT